ncbi:SCP2 sterol-binding domain-containing protein [Shewanella eurypsychrophilus]|uniref:Ubiquinone biosynthesis accessory factor UbiJ n=1 Tax=Shewanella eurypsychrophilus TaxID=2593656 RepID=A0ABX6V1F4_9GAMM|nr:MULTISPECIES: SCP2 sterol-binding domain-containing protein [Shewanella]QFU21155.1 sterol-binding protein [Shewanella sp. YLB-09]QPG56446.1 SCP2 sterol-binding domain-containing protein [Shewanella eurypsychrophilus]
MKREMALLLSAGLETALKQVVAQSPQEYAKLRTLHGQVLCIQLSQLSWPLYFIFASEIQVLGKYEGEVTTKVNADITTLYQLTEGANLTELIKQDKLSIEGDLSLLQTFSHYLQHVEFDFAEPLSNYLGDAPTHFLSQGVKQAKSDLLQVLNKSRSHIGQLTTEEYKLAPHKIEFIHLGDRIDDLVVDVDAIETRINQLLSDFKTKANAKT